MSEILSAVEIEDVLSSIRRLVSEDLRPAARGVSDTGMGAAKPALILTPALRVVPDAEPARDARAAMPVQEVVASVSAAVEAQGQDWEPETGDAGIAAEQVWADAAWDAPDCAATVAEPMPEGEVLEGEVLPAEETVDGPAAPGWAQAGVEEVVAEPVPEPEPPAVDPDWVEQAEAEVIAGLEQDQPPQHPDDALQADAELTYDEEVLRDLVRDLIREELQGPLGERITRNIRKLVRAEIARALAVQDLV